MKVIQKSLASEIKNGSGEQQLDQQSLIQPQEQHQELVELPESRQPELEQQQPSDGKPREVTTFDNKLAEMPQKEE